MDQVVNSMVAAVLALWLNLVLYSTWENRNID